MRYDELLKGNRLPVIVIAISVILLVCNIIRIIQVGVTYDEATTYLDYISANYQNIIENVPTSANNHVLNSLLARFFTQNLVDTLFVIRIPSLLAQVFYLLFSYLLSTRLLNNRLWILTLFLALQLNPFLFEFMGLSRGYALAIAMMMASIYYFILYTKESKTSMLSLSLIFMMAGVYANLSLLNFTTGLFAVLILHLLFKRKKILFIKAMLAVSMSIVCLYVLIGNHVVELRNAAQLYFGGQTNFVTDTIGSLLRDSLHMQHGSLVIYPVSLLLVMLMMLSGFYWMMAIIKRKEGAFVGMALWLLYFIPAQSTIVQHHLLGTPYLIERTALFFYPLLILSLLCTLYHILKNIPQVLYITGWALPILFLFNFSSNINLSSTHSWPFDQHTDWMMKRMVNTKQGNSKIKLYVDWLLSGSFRYSIKKHYPERFDYLEGYGESIYQKEEYDFYIVKDYEVNKVPDTYMLDTVLTNEKVFIYKKKVQHID